MFRNQFFQTAAADSPPSLNDYVLTRPSIGMLSLTSPTSYNINAGTLTVPGINNFSIGFTWTFCGVPYTQIARWYIYGFLQLGGTFPNVMYSGYPNSPQSSWINGTNDSVILAPWWGLAQLPSAPGFLRTELQGVAPNRVRVFQWNVLQTGDSLLTNVNFQCVLYETTNVLEFRYGQLDYYGGASRADYACGVKLDTTSGQSGNIRDFFGANGTPAGSVGPFRTNLISRSNPLTAPNTYWPNIAPNAVSSSTYGLRLTPP